MRKLLILLLLAGLLTGCRQDDNPTGATPATDGAPASLDPTPEANAVAETTPSATDTPSPTPLPTATPRPPKDLVVCVGAEPADLYLYGDDSIAATAIRHALYESPVTSLGYDYQALALEKLPSLADGDAQVQTVEVAEGDLVITAAGELAPLGQGTTVLNADGQPVTYDGQPITMAQLVVDYTFRPLVWSDGTPVTAEDSVFSFEVARDRTTPRPNTQARYTASYEATGERSVRWTGLPGYHDPAFMTHVWPPLPHHQLGDFSPAELPTLDEAARAPLSYGAFVVESWTPGESIRLVPNPSYYRAAEGLPHLTSLTFRFLAQRPRGLPEGYEGCHVLTSDVLPFDALPAVDAAAEEGELVEYVASAGVIEQIIFGIDSSAIFEETHTPWFTDTRVRQAVAQCIDRQALADEFTGGRATVMDTFVPPDHTLLPADLPQWVYDPAAANTLLDEVGLRDANGDGVREAIGATRSFSITLGTVAGDPLREQLNARVRDNLAACGIQVNPYTLDAGAWFAPGPSGTVFGRKFDLAQFAWLSRIHPDCGLYLTANIPGPLEQGFNGWDGVNVAGWSNEAYDAACTRALSLLPGQEGYVEAHQEAMRIFAVELPAVPLFSRLRLAATTPDVLNFRLDPSQPSELWNAFELDMTVGGP
jgi:peptide/nickel transport system substrate-binding protein